MGIYFELCIKHAAFELEIGSEHFERQGSGLSQIFKLIVSAKGKIPNVYLRSFESIRDRTLGTILYFTVFPPDTLLILRKGQETIE